MRLMPWSKADKANIVDNSMQEAAKEATASIKREITQIKTGNKLNLEISKLKSQVATYQNEFGINMMAKKYAGEAVTVNSAFGLDVVYACIRDKAESIGQLPIIVKRNGKKLTRGMREYRIFAQKPNDYMTTQDLLEMYVTCMEARGNFYMLPVYNKHKNIAEIIPFRFQENVKCSMDQNGRVYYTYVTNDGKPNICFAGDDVMHIKLNSLDGLVGLSPIATAARAFGVAIAQETHLDSLMGNAAMPKGILHTDNVFEDSTSANSAIQRLRNDWSELYGGAKNSGKTPILEHGLKYQAIGLSPADSELIKQRTFSRIQLLGIFRMPGHRHGVFDAQKGYSLEENNRAYLRDSLVPLMVKWENCFNNELPDTLEIRIDESKFTRGDRVSMVESLKAEFSTGSIHMNEMREGLDRDPIVGGDVHAIDTNNFTFGKLTDIPKLQEQQRLLAEQAAKPVNNEQPEQGQGEEDATT